MDMQRHVAADKVLPAPGFWVRQALKHAAHLLPAQGPMSVFVHHNTLHAFQHLPFHEAVVRAHETLGGEPYLTLVDYRAAYARGRISAADLDAILERDAPADRPLAGGVVTRRRLQRLAMVQGLDAETPGGLSFLLHEMGMLQRPPADTPPDAAARLDARGKMPEQLVALWKIASTITPGVHPVAPAPFMLGRDGSHQDGLARLGKDTQLLRQVHSLAIRVAEGFLDLGMAAWPMPHRVEGLWSAFLALFARRTLLAPEWSVLGSLLKDFEGAPVDASLAVERALDALAIPVAHREDHLRHVLLSLPGWCGMFHRLEAQPHEGPPGVPVRLMDFLAVLLWVEVAVVRSAAVDVLGAGATAQDLADAYRKAHNITPPPGPESTAYRVWRLLVLSGVTANQAATLTAADGSELLAELRTFDALTRRRLWHEAYEKHHRELHLDALAALRRNQEGPRAAHAGDRFQVVFCIDEREESFRRHVEELEPDACTFGTAGFFGLAIQYADADEAHSVPLCPVGQAPTHVVHEIPLEADTHARRQTQRRWMADLWQRLRAASRGAVPGFLVSVGLGALAGVTTAARVAFPRSAGRARAAAEDAFVARSRTRLGALRDENPHSGFTPTEAAAKVASLLQNVGLVSGFAPVVAFLGHGSTSLNNPHESAHDCGACGGRRGAPNARLVASLANEPAVREQLTKLGIHIPDTTVFVGGYHDTSSDEVTLFDTHAIPQKMAEPFAALTQTLNNARARNAHERSRRFAWAPRPATPGKALQHVEARADAIHEPRPEYGHCTNAMAVVGRRNLTRGLFLDRRAFLVSYDPSLDTSGAVLERILSAVGPVGAGISLEYYFSFVDNQRWGCGTKLPHNVTGLLGVMDGHQSDLRTGLPLQMVELHEPVRLLMMVEATPERLLEIAGRQPAVKELVVNAWVQLVSVDPVTGAMNVFTNGGFQPYHPRPVHLPAVSRSDAWYQGRAEHLGPALVLAGDRRLAS